MRSRRNPGFFILGSYYPLFVLIYSFDNLH
uniref:Uncharacterized protein n=1 Tax=Myoviridae sp. ctzyI3 TaxID=2826722 RepID=A0A8S5MMQ5_9CAUD|nr:MAG TPA: hypothetical protein [Myoviridae sp. ctzyI3]